MLQYPHPLEHYPPDWIEELYQIRDKETLINLEKRHPPRLKTSTLLTFFHRLEELCKLPSLPALPIFPEGRFSFLYMIPKKQHEIKKLAPFVNHFSKALGIDQIVDIGGGQGHLAQSLTNHYNLRTLSLDMDQSLQATGKKRHQKNYKFPENRVEFLTLKVTAEEPRFVSLLGEKTLTLGLHTCGPLANYQLQSSCKKRIKGIISIGCCFDKLAGHTGCQNISKFSQGMKNQLYFNQYALTLATRAHQKMSEKDHVFKLKVKFYRYAIHFLLWDVYGITENVTLGNTHPKVYNASFAEYAQEQLKRLSLPCKQTQDELNAFFEQSKIQDLIWKMLAAGLIRNALGRILELYILLDRAIFLEEQDYRVSIMEFFDEPLSPRNIGIVAELN